MKTELITIKFDAEADCETYRRAGELLRDGELVAFPTETVYGLGGNGLNPEAARRIYEAKGRPSDNPLILHIADRKDLDPLVSDVPEMAERLMEQCWPGPLTLVFRKSDLVPKETTGGLDTVAIRMPSHPVAAAMIRAAKVPIAAPSANRSGRPSCTTAAHVLEDLDGRIPMILDGGAVEIGLESTIIDVTGECAVILRPGYISREKVEELLGSCEIDPAIVGKPSEDLRPKAPGMKYRHYAPRAEMTIVEGEHAPREILRMAEEQERAGRKVAILCAEESRHLYGGHYVKTIGLRTSEDTIAHNLFRCLREFDEEQVDVIFSESYGGGNLGAAIMNRLIKAAGYHILKPEE